MTPEEGCICVPDGIQVDKNGPILYNILYHANAIITGPPSSPYPYVFFRDNFPPCFVVSDDTWYPFVLYGLFLREGNAFWKYAHVLGWNGSYLVVHVVCRVRKSAVVVLEVLLRCAERHDEYRMDKM